MAKLTLLLLLSAAGLMSAVGLPLPVPADNFPVKTPVPVVLWHGMGDNCCLPFSMGAVKAMIENAVTDAYVVSLMLGSNPADDSYNSYFMPVHKQLEMACDVVSTDPKLSLGFHAIGFSQGGLFVRALAQMCPGAKIVNLISVGGV